MKFDKFAVPVGADYIFLINEERERPHMVDFINHKREKCHDGGAWYSAAWSNMIVGLRAGYIKTVYVFSKETFMAHRDKPAPKTKEEAELLFDAICDNVFIKDTLDRYRISFKQGMYGRLINRVMHHFPSETDAREWANANIPCGATFAEVHKFD